MHDALITLDEIYWNKKTHRLVQFVRLTEDIATRSVRNFNTISICVNSLPIQV